MGLIWIPRLATGIDWQDNQHKELFVRINDLIDAMPQKKGKGDLVVLFDFLDDYVKEHFRNEEVAMSRFKYPAEGLHKGQHKEFVDNIIYLKQRFEDEDDSGLEMEARKLLADWFFNHIQKIDKQLGDFLLVNLKHSVSNLGGVKFAT